MEEKQNFPRATGFSGKILIALLFILSGILLFARNMGWITSEVFDLIVSWHSLLILFGLQLGRSRDLCPVGLDSRLQMQCFLWRM